MQAFIYMHIYTYAMIINGAKTVMSYYVATNLSVLKCEQTAQSSSFCKHHRAFFCLSILCYIKSWQTS